LKQFGLFHPHEETLTEKLKGTFMAYQVECGRSFYAWFVALTMDEYRRLGEKSDLTGLDLLKLVSKQPQSR
jgi:hypothetical protein